MATIAKSLIVIIGLFTLISQGLCDICTNNNIKIVTTESGNVVQGKPEWNVVVTNTATPATLQVCSSQYKSDLQGCKAFQTAEPVSPSILSQQDVMTYLLIKGVSLASGASVKFSYAWDFAFCIYPASSVSIPC